MTVLSLHWRVARLRRPIAIARRLGAARELGAARRPARPGRRAYPDPFFADPTLVEDDARRMTRPGDPAR
jgi:hypothetical protein